MTRIPAAAALTLLACLVGCDARLQRPPTAAYAPWEEGLTLVYERMDLPPEQRFQKRVQIRVAKSALEGTDRKVEWTTSSLQGQIRTQALLRDGGVLLGDGKIFETIMLPPGFPDHGQQWTSGPERFEVVGRSEVRLPGLENLPLASRTGVWVEARTVDGGRHRILYVPNIGQAEVRTLKDGVWTSVTRLVSRGFTDAPLESR